MLWNIISGSIGAALLGAIIWLLKIWLEHIVQKGAEDVYAARQQYREAEINKQLETWKAGYQKALDEHRIRFSKLSEEQAIVIKKTYTLLSKLYRHANGIDGKSFKRTIHDEKHRNKFLDTYMSLDEYYDENQIFYPADISGNIQRILEICGEILYTPSHPAHATKTEEEIQQLIDTLCDEIPEFRWALTLQFRKLLGIPAPESTNIP